MFRGIPWRLVLKIRFQSRMREGRIKLSGFEERHFMRKGCKSAGRCPDVKDLCERNEPPMGDVMVKCHLYV